MFYSAVRRHTESLRFGRGLNCCNFVQDRLVARRHTRGLVLRSTHHAVQIRRLESMSSVRPCRGDQRGAILAIVNAAAEAYRGVIPADCWHEPYMSLQEFDGEIAAGVEFWGYEGEGKLIGVMGIQPVRDVDLIRHAYVLPGSQRGGVGAALLHHLRQRSPRQMLVGTWSSAAWAIRFYGQHGFELVAPERKTELLKTYWTITERQIETSVVLANPPLPIQSPSDGIERSSPSGGS
jgi:GNAT superfamily N-acetyltransferase